jgi:2-aminoadipate transaminase
MRLNFAGVPEENIREGIRRIGEAVGEQLALYGTLSGAPPAGLRSGATRGGRSAGEGGPPEGSAALPGAAAGTAAEDEAGLAEVVELPRRRAKGR